MKKSLIFLAFAMIVMASCSKKGDSFNDPSVTTAKDSLVFTLSNEVTPAWIFTDSRIEVIENDICLDISLPMGRKQFYFNPKGETKVFKGEEFSYALEYGCDFVIYPVLKIHNINGGTYWDGICVPIKVTGITEKNKHYTVNFKSAMEEP